jgi:hypothetical protein
MWPVDHVLAQASGSTAMHGASCDPRLQALCVWDGPLLPGAAASLSVTGPTRTVAVCLVGGARDPALDLARQGAPGCRVLVEPFDALPWQFPRVKLEPITRVVQPLPVPALPCFFGGRFSVQWVQFPSTKNKAHLATTYALASTLGDTLPATTLASVVSGPPVGGTFPDHGEVKPSWGPVLRFVAR